MGSLIDLIFFQVRSKIVFWVKFLRSGIGEESHKRNTHNGFYTYAVATVEGSTRDWPLYRSAEAPLGSRIERATLSPSIPDLKSHLLPPSSPKQASLTEAIWKTAMYMGKMSSLLRNLAILYPEVGALRYMALRYLCRIVAYIGQLDSASSAQPTIHAIRLVPSGDP